jgi:hypothetical protein
MVMMLAYLSTCGQIGTALRSFLTGKRLVALV